MNQSNTTPDKTQSNGYLARKRSKSIEIKTKYRSKSRDSSKSEGPTRTQKRQYKNSSKSIEDNDCLKSFSELKIKMEKLPPTFHTNETETFSELDDIRDCFDTSHMNLKVEDFDDFFSEYLFREKLIGYKGPYPFQRETGIVNQKLISRKFQKPHGKYSTNKLNVLESEGSHRKSNQRKSDPSEIPNAIKINSKTSNVKNRNAQLNTENNTNVKNNNLSNEQVMETVSEKRQIQKGKPMKINKASVSANGALKRKSQSQEQCEIENKKLSCASSKNKVLSPQVTNSKSTKSESKSSESRRLKRNQKVFRKNVFKSRRDQIRSKRSKVSLRPRTGNKLLRSRSAVVNLTVNGNNKILVKKRKRSMQIESAVRKQKGGKVVQVKILSNGSNIDVPSSTLTLTPELEGLMKTQQLKNLAPEHLKALFERKVFLKSKNEVDSGLNSETGTKIKRVSYESCEDKCEAEDTLSNALKDETLSQDKHKDTFSSEDSFASLEISANHKIQNTTDSSEEKIDVKMHDHSEPSDFISIDVPSYTVLTEIPTSSQIEDIAEEVTSFPEISNLSQVEALEDGVQPCDSSSRFEQKQMYSESENSYTTDSSSTSDYSNRPCEDEDSNLVSCTTGPETINTDQITSTNCHYVPLNPTVEVKSLQRSLMQPVRKPSSTFETSECLPLNWDSEGSSPTKKERMNLAHLLKVNDLYGAVIDACYLDYNLVIVQELLVSFWSQTALGNVLGAQNMWVPRGSVQRLLLGDGCTRKWSRETMVSLEHSAAYIELWTKEHKSFNRERPVADIFAVIYFWKQKCVGVEKKVLQLENIKG